MSPIPEDDAEALRRLLAAVRGAEEEFVIVGGQAARILRWHPLAVALPWDPTLTRDIDVASADRGHRSRVNVAAALEREGFVARYDGDDRPPMTHYVRGQSEVEFIVPSLPRRDAGGAFVEVLGATAQKVADLEPVLIAPTEIMVENIGVVRVPNPAAFVIQKILTVTNRRQLYKKGKDALYIHDVLLMFTVGGRLRDEVTAQARSVVATLSKRQLKRLTENVAKLGDPTTDFLREAWAQTENRAGRVSVDAMAFANRSGLRELLAT
ncbi:MAG: GSU2403 family nucleotidyltransferase fold protein [Archangium sp.]